MGMGARSPSHCFRGGEGGQAAITIPSHYPQLCLPLAPTLSGTWQTPQLLS